MKKKLSKIALMLLICFVSLLGIKSIKAEEITIETLTKELKESDIFEMLETPPEITNTEDKIILKFASTEDNISYTTNIEYKNGLISYVFEGDKISSEVMNKYFTDSITFYGLTNIAYKLKGYDQYQIASYLENLDYDSITLDNEGIEQTEFQYTLTKEVSGLEEDVELDLIDTFKLDVNKISIPESENVPVLELSEITENSITVKATLEEASSGQLCYLYRAKEDEVFELVIGINCSIIDGEINLIDDELEPNTTYHYKAAVPGYSNFGEVVSATTKKEETTQQPNKESNEQPNEEKNNKNQTVKNPDTGINVSYISIAAVALSSIAIIVYINKKNLFKKI